jgi:hypothetical protein
MAMKLLSIVCVAVVVLVVVGGGVAFAEHEVAVKHGAIALNEAAVERGAGVAARNLDVCALFKLTPSNNQRGQFLKRG